MAVKRTRYVLATGFWWRNDDDTKVSISKKDDGQAMEALKFPPLTELVKYRLVLERVPLRKGAKA